MLHCSHAFYSNYAEHLTSSSHRQEIQSYTFRRFTPMEYAALQMSKIEESQNGRIQIFIGRKRFSGEETIRSSDAFT